MPFEFHLRLGSIHCELDGRIRMERDNGFVMQFLVKIDSQNFQRLFATPVDPNSDIKIVATTLLHHRAHERHEIRHGTFDGIRANLPTIQVFTGVLPVPTDSRCNRNRTVLMDTHPRFTPDRGLISSSGERPPSTQAWSKFITINIFQRMNAITSYARKPEFLSLFEKVRYIIACQLAADSRKAWMGNRYKPSTFA